MTEEEKRAHALQAASRIAANKSWSQQDVLRYAQELLAWIKTGTIREERRW